MLSNEVDRQSRTLSSLYSYSTIIIFVEMFCLSFYVCIHACLCVCERDSGGAGVTIMIREEW